MIVSKEDIVQGLYRDYQRYIPELNLSNDILQREIEILILRNLISCKIEKDNIVLNSS